MSSGDNSPTDVVSAPKGPRLTVEDQRSFYSRAMALLAEESSHERVGQPPRVRLFWGRRHEIRWRDLSTEPGAYAVVGRHSRCDVQLDGDPEVSLRHLLASAHARPDGTLSLRLLNLRASLPFFLDDTTPHWSLVGSGPIVLRLGAYVLAAVPLLPPSAADVIRGGPPESDGISRVVREMPRYDTSYSAVPDPFTAPAPAPAAAAPFAGRTQPGPLPPSARCGGGSTASGASPSLVASCQQVTDLSMVCAQTRSGEQVFARLGFERAGMGALVTVSEEDLKLGVLIGRSARCLDRGVASVLSEAISRVHLLLLREGGRTCAYDLCSTNGTWLHDAEARFIPLPRRLTLGLGRRLRMRWIQDAGAFSPLDGP